MADLRGLLRQFPCAGVLEAIYLRPGRRVAARLVMEAAAVAGSGLKGDRTGDRAIAAPAGAGGKRQVTLIQAEHVPLIGAWTGRPALDAAVLRRNLVVRGFNLLAARSPFADQVVRLWIGADVVIEITGPCDPCSKMEVALGSGACNAMRGHGGVTARVLVGGRLAIGDAVRVEALAREQSPVREPIPPSTSMP